MKSGKLLDLDRLFSNDRPPAGPPPRPVVRTQPTAPDPDAEYARQERAAIHEFDGGLTRAEAERLAGVAGGRPKSDAEVMADQRTAELLAIVRAGASRTAAQIAAYTGYALGDVERAMQPLLAEGWVALVDGTYSLARPPAVGPLPNPPPSR